MADVPQPAPEPYEPGDKVRVYVSEDDANDDVQGLVCIVIERLEEDPGSDGESRDDLDRYSYRVKNTNTGEELPTTFDHSDLVSVE